MKSPSWSKKRENSSRMEIFLKTHPMPNLLKEAPQLKISDQFSIPKLIRYNRSLNFIDTYLQKAHLTSREIEIV